MLLTHGSSSAWDSLLYGENNPQTVSFLQNQIASVGSVLTNAGREFMDRSRAAFDHFNGSEAMRFAREAVRSVQGMFEVPRIRQLFTVEDFTKATDIMQRWVMANPNVRNRYFDQRIDGYSDTYQNVHGTDIKEKHYDYRRVMDGIIEFNEEDGWKSTEYVEPLIEGDRDLLFEEQLDILRTWNAVDLLIQLGKDDPTSTVGGKL